MFKKILNANRGEIALRVIKKKRLEVQDIVFSSSKIDKGRKSLEIIFLKVQFGKIKPKHFKSKTYHKNIFYDSWDFNVYNRYD